MDSIKTTKINDDLRFYFGLGYFIIAIILLIIGPAIVELKWVKVENAILFDTFLKCLTFTFFGFSFLILKICINKIIIVEPIKPLTPHEIKEIQVKEDKAQVERRKNLLRHCLFYPILLFVLAVLSAIISIKLFYKTGESDDIKFFIQTALLSFFLGFFFDSIPTIVEKIGKSLSN